MQDIWARATKFPLQGEILEMEAALCLRKEFLADSCHVKSCHCCDAHIEFLYLWQMFSFILIYNIASINIHYLSTDYGHFQ
jgi:hypothetical protein